MTKSRSGFLGVYPMLYALFDSKGYLSRAAMKRQVQAMLANGAHGIGLLGLGSEVNKLSTPERRKFMEWTAEEVDGQVPLFVTLAEANSYCQIEMLRGAVSVGAKWVLLQPPPVKDVPEIEIIRFFGGVADSSEVPVGIQSAPEYLSSDLSIMGLKTLARNHPNISILKVEATAVGVERLLEETRGRSISSTVGLVSRCLILSVPVASESFRW